MPLFTRDAVCECGRAQNHEQIGWRGQSIPKMDEICLLSWQVSFRRLPFLRGLAGRFLAPCPKQ